MSSSKLKPGTPIVVVLHTPREKFWGALDEITLAGVFLRGLDLNAFDAWTSAVAHDEPFGACSDLFFPMWRVERISRDEESGGVPSLYSQVEQGTGRTVQELLATDESSESS